MKNLAIKTAGILFLAACYFIVGKFSLMLAISPGFASAIWPPSGIALAALVWWDYWLWPGIWLGAFLLNSWVSLPQSSPLVSFTTAFCIATGSTLQALLGCYLIRRFIGSKAIFAEAQRVFKFVGIVVLSVFIASTFGVTALSLFGLVSWGDYAYTWGTWWMGDLVGIILFTPLILICLTPQRFQWGVWRMLEFFLLAVLLGFASLLIFGGYIPLSKENYPIAYPLILFMLWIAFRFSQREIVVATFYISLLALWGTAKGVGPFYKGSLNDSLLFMQSFMAIISITVLVLSATLTERKEFEEAVQKERDQAQQYLNIAGVLIVALDTEGRITLINQRGCECLGYSKAEIIGHNWFDVCLPPRIRGPAKSTFHRQMIGEIDPVEYFESPIINKSGEERLMAFHNSLIKGQAGQKIGMLFSGEDITDRKRAEEEKIRFLKEQEELNSLKESERLRDEFLSVISHELRTPLNAIEGFSSIMNDEITGTLNEDQHDLLEKILRASDRMLSLINDILDFARMRSGKFSVSKEPTSYPSLVKDVVDSLLPLVKAKRLELTTNIQVPVEVNIDRQRISQVLTNLLANSIKFTPEGGQIVVRAFIVDKNLVTEVQDNGIGINPEDIKKLFIPFIQLTAFRKAGSGLGLSISKALVEAHGGNISAQSLGLGKGATFRFSLPLQ